MDARQGAMRRLGHGNRTMSNANPVSADPRVPVRTDNTDFRHLSPGQFARHTGRSSEKEAMNSGHGVANHLAGFPGRLGAPSQPSGFLGRDVRKAAASAALTKKGT